MIRFGMVGTGKIVSVHSNAILAHPECELVAVADIAIEKAKDVAEKHGAKAFTDYKEMCDTVELDAVILNLPHFLHYEASVYFLERGVHVLVEKPMAMNVEECDSMIEIAKKNNVKLAVGHTQRFNDNVERIAEIIKNGTLGKLCNIVEYRGEDYLPGRPEWFLKKEQSGGGIVMNFGVHAIDRVLSATGLKIEKVHSVVSNPMSDHNVELVAQMMFELSDGSTSMVTLNGIHAPYEYHTTFYFTDGRAHLQGNVLTISTKEKTEEFTATSASFNTQIEEFVKYIKGKESRVATDEYGKEIMQVIKQII